MRSLRLVTVLGLMLAASLAVPHSTQAAERDRHSSRGYSNNRYERRDTGRSNGYGYRPYRGYGRSYGYAPRYAYGYRRPAYAYSYGYAPYYYDDPYYYDAPPVYARPYYGPRVGVVVGRPRVGLYLGW